MLDNDPINWVDKYGLEAYEVNKKGAVTVKKCNVVIFYGHGLREVKGGPKIEDATDEQLRKSSRLPVEVKNEQCSAAEIFGCNTGRYTTVEQETVGAENPMDERPGNKKSDLEGLLDRARKEAARICVGKQENGGPSTCCKSVTITFDCSALKWYQRSNYCGKTETVTCGKNQ